VCGGAQGVRLIFRAHELGSTGEPTLVDALRITIDPIEPGLRRLREAGLVSKGPDGVELTSADVELRGRLIDARVTSPLVELASAWGLLAHPELGSATPPSTSRRDSSSG
jgi:hypothetical protein